MIPFNRPSVSELEESYITEALKGRQSGDGPYTKKAAAMFNKATGVPNLMLTTSCTHALELAALLCGIRPGDEVILPSYTFSSTANAFLLRGAKLIFCDIRPDTLNLDENLLPGLISRDTKAIIPVHYAGVPCEMNVINDLARKNNLFVIEDAAQAVGSTYNGIPCGMLSDIGCYSFHETKNYSMGEGGGIVIRDDEMQKIAEIIREKGTDRSGFLRGEVDKYTWRQSGSSYLPSDVLAALLCAQLTRFDEILHERQRIWYIYHNTFDILELHGWRRPIIPENVIHNAHMYYLLAPTNKERNVFINIMKNMDIQVVSHYEPLHASPMGRKLGYKPNDLPITMDLSSRIVRLPLWVGMDIKMLEHIKINVTYNVAKCRDEKVWS